MAHGQGGQLLDGHALTDQGSGCGQYVDVVGAEEFAFRAVVQRRQQTGVYHEVDYEGGNVGPFGEFRPVEQETGLIGFGRGGAVGHAHHATSLGSERTVAVHPAGLRSSG